MKTLLKIIRIIIISFFALFAGMVLLSIAMTPKDAQSQSTSSTSPPPTAKAAAVRAEPPIETTVSEISRAYTANPIAADARFRGKTIVITGRIYDIDREIMGHPYVILGNHDVQCVFRKSSESEVTTLAKGRDVTILGTVKGTGLMKTVLIDDCQLDDEQPTEIRRAVAAKK